VRDGGVLQSIREIEIEQLPLNVMIALDTSGSVAGRRLEYLVNASGALLDGLLPKDRIALLSFSTRVRLLAPLTPSRDQVRAALSAMKGAGTTSLRDAAFSALALREDDPGRTLMLLFSDGADTSSFLDAGDVIEAAKRTDVVVYPVGIRQRVTLITESGYLVSRRELSGARVPTIDITQAGKFLTDLAEATGGRVMLAGADADLRDTFVGILAEFRNRYVLTYEPAGIPAGGWHPIEVKLKRTSGKITARRGYFAQPVQ
jgi:VWFA-related protein